MTALTRTSRVERVLHKDWTGNVQLENKTAGRELKGLGAKTN
jgi:hypothetical protein